MWPRHSSMPGSSPRSCDARPRHTCCGRGMLLNYGDASRSNVENHCVPVKALRGIVEHDIPSGM